jgi:hypothetical protein
VSSAKLVNLPGRDLNQGTPECEMRASGNLLCFSLHCNAFRLTAAPLNISAVATLTPNATYYITPVNVLLLSHSRSPTTPLPATSHVSPHYVNVCQYVFMPQQICSYISDATAHKRSSSMSSVRHETTRQEVVCARS